MQWSGLDGQATGSWSMSYTGSPAASICSFSSRERSTPSVCLIYGRLGFRETGRISEKGYERVYMAKALA